MVSFTFLLIGLGEPVGKRRGVGGVYSIIKSTTRRYNKEVVAYIS
jgi:hypothetical protein